MVFKSDRQVCFFLKKKKIECINIVKHTPHQLVAVMYQIIDSQPPQRKSEEEDKTKKKKKS